jgi:hypothetical protein
MKNDNRIAKVRKILMLSSLLIWVCSIISFLCASFLFRARSDGLYTNSQSLILMVSVVVGAVSFLILVATIISKFYRSIKASFSRVFIILLMVGMWGLGWISVRIFDSQQPIVSTSTPITIKDMLPFINEERAKQGIAPVVFDERIAKAAEAKACDMNARNYFEHKDPQGRWGWHFLTENKVPYTWAGENIAKNDISPDTERVMKGFMNSPEHRAILLDPKYVFVGYASCGVYTVQYFVK